MSENARDYAIRNGAPVMLYPNTDPPFEKRFMECPELTASQIVNRQRICALIVIFGRRQWPSNG